MDDFDKAIGPQEDAFRKGMLAGEKIILEHLLSAVVLHDYETIGQIKGHINNRLDELKERDNEQ